MKWTTYFKTAIEKSLAEISFISPFDTFEQCFQELTQLENEREQS